MMSAPPCFWRAYWSRTSERAAGDWSMRLNGQLGRALDLDGTGRGKGYEASRSRTITDSSSVTRAQRRASSPEKAAG